MMMKMKIRSHRHGINSPRSRHIVNSKYIGDLKKTQRKRRRGQKFLRCDVIRCRSRPQQKPPYKL